MKHILLNIILVSSYLSALQPNDVQFYSINIKLPSFISDHTHIPAYYKGHRIDLHDGWVRLPECGQPCMFSLLITEDVDFKTKGNTVTYLKRLPEKEYSWYDITLTLCKKQQDIVSLEANDHKKTGTIHERSYTWDIEKRNQEDAPERIPEHTIILLTNPDFIESLKAESSIPGSIDIALPTIVFKKDIDPKIFEESILTVLVGAALNLNAIHTKEDPACMKQESKLISLAQKKYESEQ